jgi:hypothetical protein
MTPAETLRAAAERLRELAKDATPGPWRFELRPLAGVNPSVEEAWVVGPLGEDVSGTIEVARGYAHEADDADGPWLVEPDGRWIAALSPAVAEPLAAWLEQRSTWCAQCVHDDPVYDAERWMMWELAVARAILGGDR